VIFISQDAHVAVTKYLKLRKEVKGPLFVSHGRNRDKRLSTVSIESIVRNYAIKAGITKKVTPHSIRHTFATELRKKGVDITFIKDFLGHSSILTTTIYLHVSNQELKNIHQTFLK
jgi:site-specific recombinase XerD